MVKSFLTGAIGGAVAAWWLKDAITAKIEARTRAVRRTIASRLHAVAETIDHGSEGGPCADAPPHIARTS